MNAALNMLQIDPMNFNAETLKRAYHRMALLHHPDKNGNTAESNEKFQQIYDAYELLQKELDLNECETSKIPSYADIIRSFVDELVKGKHDELFAKVANTIAQGCEQISMQLFEGMDKDTSLKLFQFLSKHQLALRLTDELLAKVREIVIQKCGNTSVYVLKPTLDDLLTCKVYLLEVDGGKFYVPLWHSELYFEGTGGREIVVLCEPALPDGVQIDEHGNVHLQMNLCLTDLEIGGAIKIDDVGEYVSVDQLRIQREQTIRLKYKGLPLLTDNIYDWDMKADIVVRIILS
jgi:hypothetical protein